MHRAFRRALGPVLALSVFAGMLAPAAAAQAASPQHHHVSTVVRWSAAAMERTVMRGHEAVVVAHFRTSHTIRRAVFTLRLGGGLYARPVAITWGTVTPNRWHDLAFTIGAPSWMHSGLYAGTIRLDRWSGDDVESVGAPLHLTIRVQVPPVSPAPVITWTPAHLGTLNVAQGQTVTETASFVSDVTLTGAQIVRELNTYPATHGIAVNVVGVSPAATTTFAAHTPYNVTFTLAASSNAPVAVYPAALHLTATINGRPGVLLWRDLDFNISVQRNGPTISWTPDGLSTITLLQGQTVTETASFTSNVALTAVQAAQELKGLAASRGLSIAVVSMNPATPTVAANTPYAVTFTVSASAIATPGQYTGDVYLQGSFNGAPVARLWHELGFKVDVDRLTPTVAWLSGSPISLPTITRGAATVSVTETANFSASVALSNASVAGQLSGGTAAQGITLTPAALPGGAVAANTPLTASFTLSVPATAHAGVYSGDLWLMGQVAGAAAPVRIYHTLHFVFAVN